MSRSIDELNGHPISIYRFRIGFIINEMMRSKG